MSVDLPSEEVKVLASKIEEVERQAAEVSALSAHWSMRFLQLLILLILVMVGFVLYKGVATYNHLTSDKYQAEFKEKAQKHFEKNSDPYLKEVQKLTDTVSPVLGDAFASQFQKDMPAYIHNLELESGKFRENMETQLSARMDNYYLKAIDKHMPILEEEVGNLSESQKERMALNLHRAAHQLVQKYNVTQMNNEIDRLYKVWETFPEAKQPGKNEEPLDKQWVAGWLDLAGYRLAQKPVQP